MGNSESYKNKLIDSNTNENAEYEYINELESKVQADFEGYKRFKKYFTIFVSIIIIFHVIILICEYFYGGFKLKESPSENPILNDQYFNMTYNLNNYQFINLNYDIKSMYCFDINPCSYSPLDGTIIKKEIKSNPEVSFPKICKSQILINFNTFQLKKEKKSFVNCDSGYIIEGSNCPSIDSFILNNTNLVSSDYMINLCIEDQKLQARYRIPIKQNCVETFKKNVFLYTMNDYTGTYLVYTIIHICIILMEINLIIRLNMKFKAVRTHTEKFESRTVTKFTENIRQNGQLYQIDREAVNRETYEKDYYVIKKQTFDDKLFTMRFLTVCILIFLIFMAFNLSQQKVSSYNESFNFIYNLYSNNCFIDETYINIFKNLYENNIENFSFFFYYRYCINYVSLGCFILICIVDLRFFTFKEFFTQCKSIKVSTSEADKAAKGFEY